MTTIKEKVNMQRMGFLGRDKRRTYQCIFMDGVCSEVHVGKSQRQILRSASASTGKWIATSAHENDTFQSERVHRMCGVSRWRNLDGC